MLVWGSWNGVMYALPVELIMVGRCGVYTASTGGMSIIGLFDVGSYGGGVPYSKCGAAGMSLLRDETLAGNMPSID